MPNKICDNGGHKVDIRNQRGLSYILNGCFRCISRGLEDTSQMTVKAVTADVRHQKWFRIRVWDGDLSAYLESTGYHCRLAFV